MGSEVWVELGMFVLLLLGVLYVFLCGDGWVLLCVMIDFWLKGVCKKIVVVCLLNWLELV